MTEPLTIDDAIERVTAVLADLRAQQDVVAPRAPVDPNGYPGAVATGELIEASWGNATRTKLLEHGTGVAASVQSTTPLRLWTWYGALAANAVGAGNITWPAGYFTAKPVFAAVDDMYTAAGVPAQWLRYKPDWANTDTTRMGVQVARWTGSDWAPAPTGSYNVYALVIGARTPSPP